MAHGSDVVKKHTYSLIVGGENIDFGSMTTDSYCNLKAIRQYF